ncbi:hypothetical protein [Paenibacillus sp. V4I7]|nr:hypothetical protein [Paenibacillus sp. V4I7]MDQ0899364.1 hypothetical protein [Paenibacillus sp. V4I7]
MVGRNELQKLIKLTGERQNSMQGRMKVSLYTSGIKYQIGLRRWGA